MARCSRTKLIVGNPLGGGLLSDWVYELGSTKQWRNSWYKLVFNFYRTCCGENSWYKMPPKTWKPICSKKKWFIQLMYVCERVRWRVRALLDRLTVESSSSCFCSCMYMRSSCTLRQVSVSSGELFVLCLFMLTFRLFTYLALKYINHLAR